VLLFGHRAGNDDSLTALQAGSGQIQHLGGLHVGESGILVTVGSRVGEDGEGDRPKSREAGECLLLLRRGRTLFLLDFLEGVDGGEDVACFGFFAAGDRRE
jgi:hypothetical protein